MPAWASQPFPLSWEVVKLGNVDVSVRARRSFFPCDHDSSLKVILRMYLVPFCPHQTSHSHCLVNAVSLTSPESSSQSSSSAPVRPGLSLCSVPGPLHHQAVLQPHACFPFCHTLCSLLAPQPLRLQLSVRLCTAGTPLGKGTSRRTVPLLSVYLSGHTKRHSSLDFTLQEKIRALNR